MTRVVSLNKFGWFQFIIHLHKLLHIHMSDEHAAVSSLSSHVPPSCEHDGIMWIARNIKYGNPTFWRDHVSKWFESSIRHHPGRAWIETSWNHLVSKAWMKWRAIKPALMVKQVSFANLQILQLLTSSQRLFAFLWWLHDRKMILRMDIMLSAEVNLTTESWHDYIMQYG